MNFQTLSELLASRASHLFQSEFTVISAGPQNIKLSRPVKSVVDVLGFFGGKYISRAFGMQYEVIEITPDSLKRDPIWSVPTHSGFEHRPRAGELLFFYAGSLWVLKAKDNNLVLFERNT